MPHPGSGELMGWASGGDVFDPVAQKMIALCEEKKLLPTDAIDVLATLAEYLFHRDWDTEDESLETAKGHHIVRRALCEALRRIGWKPDPEDDEEHYCLEEGKDSG